MSKDFWSKNCFNNFFGQKQICGRIIFGKKKLSKVFGPKFLVKNWLVKNFCWLKIFWSKIFFENCGDKVFGRFFFNWEGLTQREGGCRRPPPQKIVGLNHLESSYIC